MAAEASRPLPPAQTRQRRESRYLVGAPVVQGDDGEAKDDPRPGDVPGDGVSEDVEGVRAWREALHRGSPVPFPGEGRLGLRVPALQLLVPAYLVKGLKTPHSRSVPAAAQEPRQQCETRQGGRELTLCVLTGRPSPPTPAQWTLGAVRPAPPSSCFWGRPLSPAALHPTWLRRALSNCPPGILIWHVTEAWPALPVPGQLTCQEWT